MRLWMQTLEVSVLWKMAGLSLRGWGVQSSGRVSGYRYYSSRLKGARWGGLDIWCYQVCPTRKRSRDTTQAMLEKLYLLADLGTPRWAERGTGEGGLGCGPDKWKKLHGWMDGKVTLRNKLQITMTLMPMMSVCKLLNTTENVNNSILIFFQE